MAIRSVGFQLRTDGKAEVKNDFKEVQTAGEQAMDGVADAAELAAARAGKATEEYTKRQIASFEKAAAASKLAAARETNRSAFDAALAGPGSGNQFATVNLDRSTGAARDSAAVFQAAFAAEEQGAKDAAAAEAIAARAAEDRTAAVVKLRAAIDPLATAQARYGQAVASADELLAAGAITTKEHASALKLFSDQLENARKGLDGTADADARAVAAAERLKAMLDPLGAAQQRYDAELKVYQDLLARGLITEDEHRQAVKSSTDVLNQAKRSLDEHSEAFGLNRNQTLVATHALRGFVEQVLYTHSPMSAFMAQQSHLAAILSLDDGGVAGGLAKVRALLSPTAIGVAALTATVVVGASAWMSYQAAVEKAQALSMGSGRVIGISADELEAQAAAATKLGSISISTAREIADGYVQLGGIGKDVLGGLTALTVDFAAATGEEAKAAQSELGQAFQDPAAGAEELAQKYGALSQAQVEHIQKLVEEGNLYEAQRALLEALVPAFDHAAEHADLLSKAGHAISDAWHDAWNWIGKTIDRAAGGGTIAQQISYLQRERDFIRLGSNGVADLNGYDQKIAALQRQLQYQNNAGARSQAAGAMKVVDGIVGDDEVGTLRQRLNAVKTMLADNGKAAGLTADQVGRARQAYEMLTHAVGTYLPEGEKQVRLAQLDAQIAAARKGHDQARVAALTAQKTEVEQSGKLITASNAAAIATANGTKAKLDAAKGSDRHAASLAREAESMEVNARAALQVADAYLKSSTEGVAAEAQRKAATDATKKGIDVEAQARRQLALQVADQIATGAKSVAQMRDEADVRAAVMAKVQAGEISVEGMNDAISDQIKLLPLMKLRAIAQGDQLATLNKVIDATTDALARMHDQERQGQLETKMQASINHVEELKAALLDLGATPLDRALNAANRAANVEADGMNLAPGSADRVKFVRGREDEAARQYALDRASYLAKAKDDQADSLALAARELQLVGANDNYRQAELDKLREQLYIRRNFPDMDAKDIAARLDDIEALDAMNAKLRLVSDSWAEMTRFGEQMADDVLNPSNWTSWGDMGKRILGDLEAEFIKLIALNPLKNLINGNDALPTLTSIFSSLGSKNGLKGGTWYHPESAGHNASGTYNWSGGMTWVNENGPEIQDLPNGTRVYPAALSRQMAGANDQGPAISNHFHLEGAVLTQNLLDQMNAIGAGAAVRGAYGGSQMAQRDIARRQNRTMR